MFVTDYLEEQIVRAAKKKAVEKDHYERICPNAKWPEQVEACDTDNPYLCVLVTTISFGPRAARASPRRCCIAAGSQGPDGCASGPRPRLHVLAQ